MADTQALKFAVIVLAFVFTMGFFVGYGMRAFLSYRHQIEARRRWTTESLG
jgi:hypothetical protein